MAGFGKSKDRWEKSTLNFSNEDILKNEKERNKRGKEVQVDLNRLFYTCFDIIWTSYRDVIQAGVKGSSYV